jgi:transcriptional regulator GlxA family with amidase domain
MHSTRSTSTRRLPRVGILLFDDVKMLDFVGPAEVFFEANQRSPGYEIVTISRTGQPVTTSMGIQVAVQTSVADAGRLDTLIVPGTEKALTVFADPQLLDAVAELASRSTRIAGICTGAFGLAAAGLLAGKSATTHWKFSSTLAERFPDIDVQAEAIFVHDGDTFTSAGVAAGIDLALSLLELDYGPEVARSVAQLLLVYMKRSGNQSQFSAALQGPPPRTPLITVITDHISEDPSRPYTVGSLASFANVSPRHLTRVMRDELGMSPIEYVTSMRLDLAVSYLDSGASVADAAARSGYATPVSLRRSFVARFTITPSEYQRRFQSTRRDARV